MADLSTIAADTLDITCYAGDTCPFTLQCFQDDGTTPEDFTGVALKMQVKRRLKYTETAEITWVSPTDIVVSGTSHNVLNFASKVTIPGGDYVYDLQATYADGTITTLMYGAFTVQQDVTDSTTEAL